VVPLAVMSTCGVCLVYVWLLFMLDSGVRCWVACLAFLSCAFRRFTLRYSAVLYYPTLSWPALTEVKQRRDWHCVQSHIQQPKHGNMRCEIAGQELGIQLTCLAVCFFLCVSATQAESSWGWIEWNVVCDY
jgi:hypothetical protein